MDKVDVFISRKTADAAYAKKIYDYLIAQGLSVFVSDQSLREIGNADYIKAIDDALARATHLIVVGSSAENITSPWVEAEWLFFLNRKRSGKASGNLFTVIVHPMNLEELPASLANYEVIPYNTDNFPIIYNYVRESGKPSVKAPVKPLPAEKQRAWLMAAVVLLVVGYIVFYFYFSSQPYDATIFLGEQPGLNLSPSYPRFTGGELSVTINNKEERRQVLANGEVVLKQLPVSSKGEKSAAKLYSSYWRLADESIVPGKTVHLYIIPDGSLSIITGHVQTAVGLPVAHARIHVDNDTSLLSDSHGNFKIVLPYRMQKEFYELRCEKDGYQPLSEYYYPKSGKIDVVLKDISTISNQHDFETLKSEDILSGKISYYENNSPVKGAMIRLLRIDGSKSIGVDSVITDKNGVYKFSFIVNGQYILIVTKEGYAQQSDGIKIDDKKSMGYVRDFKLSKMRASERVKLNNIYFDYLSAVIKDEAAMELNKLVQVLNDNPTMKIEISSYTSSRGNDAYNLKLSDKRAKSTISYLVSKGIAPDRLIGIGYGEQKIINRCKNGVECTEQEHAYNERTDFIITAF